ncbi:hypothetical protein GW17_00057706, partial [Ensete ventricosum]
MDTNRSKNGQRPRQKVQTKKGPVIEDYLLLPGDLLPEFGGLLPESLHPPAGRRGLRNDSESGDPTQNLRDGSRQRRREATDDMVRSSANRGGYGSRADSKPFLEDDDRPGIPFTRIQPRAVHGHDRGFPRPHQPSPSTSGYGADHSPVPTPARAFDSSPIGSPGGTPANGVTHNPEPGGPARGRAATASGRRSPRSFPDPDASPITKSLLRS